MYNYLKYIGLTKGVLTITDIISVSENKKRVLVRCLCSKCGHYSEVRLDRFTIAAPYAEHYCKYCKDTYFLERAKSKYVGKINGVLECIDVIRLGNQIKVVCKCKNCKSITIVRPDRLSSSAIPKSCEHCIKDLQRHITTSRYMNASRTDTLKKYREIHHDDVRIRSIKSGAKERGLSFNLTNENVKQLLHESCYYCGTPHADGIDRIDSFKPYSEDNVVPCCKVCNIMKNKFSMETFMEHIKAIYERHCTNESSSTISKESTSQANGDGSEGNP